MVSCGITRRFPISLHLLFLQATNLCNPLKPACTIPCVVSWCLLFKVNPLQVITNLIYYLNQSALTLQRSTNLFCFSGWAILKPPSKAVNQVGFASSLTKLWMMRRLVWLWQCACKLGWQIIFIV